MPAKSSDRNHDFNVIGGDILKKIGASWFASYWYFNNVDNNETHWVNCQDVGDRIDKYNDSEQYHKTWLEYIVKNGNLKKLDTNELGLTGRQIIEFAKKA